MAKQIGNTDLIDTWASEGNIVDPDPSKKEEGWLLGEQPPHEWMNYIQNEHGQKINRLLDDTYSNGLSLRQELDGSVQDGQGARLVRGAVIYVDTVADLQTMDTSGLVEGQAASVQGSEFRWDGSEWIPLNRVSVLAFGDTASDFQEAFDWCGQRGYPIVIPSRTNEYTLDTAVFINYSLDVYQEKGADIVHTGDGPAFHRFSEISGFFDITSNASPGDFIIQAEGASGIGAGDIVLIKSDYQPRTNINSLGEYREVDSVSGDQVVLKEPLRYTYTTDRNPKITKVDFIDRLVWAGSGSVKGNPGASGQDNDCGFRLGHIRSVFIGGGLSIGSWGYAGLILEATRFSVVNDLNVYDIDSESTGYATLCSEGAENAYFSNVYAENCGKAFDTSGASSRAGWCSNLHFYDSFCRAFHRQLVGSHANATDIYVKNVSGYSNPEKGADFFGCHFRGGSHYIDNIRIDGVGSAVRWRPEIGPIMEVDFSIENCLLDNFPEEGSGQAFQLEGVEREEGKSLVNSLTIENCQFSGSDIQPLFLQGDDFDLTKSLYIRNSSVYGGIQINRFGSITLDAVSADSDITHALRINTRGMDTVYNINSGSYAGGSYGIWAEQVSGTFNVRGTIIEARNGDPCLRLTADDGASPVALISGCTVVFSGSTTTGCVEFYDDWGDGMVTVTGNNIDAVTQTPSTTVRGVRNRGTVSAGYVSGNTIKVANENNAVFDFPSAVVGPNGVFEV